MKSFRKSMLLVLLASISLGLAGCDAAEQSARELAEKAAESGRQLAQEALQDSVKILNEKVDRVQQSTTSMLGKPDAEAMEQSTENPSGEASQRLPDSIEG
jgi:vacuolar-type H+-ATPase subunit H